MIEVYDEFKLWFDSQATKSSKLKKRILEESPFTDELVQENSVFKEASESLVEKLKKKVLRYSSKKKKSLQVKKEKSLGQKIKKLTAEINQYQIKLKNVILKKRRNLLLHKTQLL